MNRKDAMAGGFLCKRLGGAKTSVVLVAKQIVGNSTEFLEPNCSLLTANCSLLTANCKTVHCKKILPELGGDCFLHFIELCDV